VKVSNNDSSPYGVDNSFFVFGIATNVRRFASLSGWNWRINVFCLKVKEKNRFLSGFEGMKKGY